MTRQAQCSCGSLVLACTGEPQMVSACHCDACRRRTGSAFGVAAFFRRTQIAIQGESRLYSRESDSGHGVDFHFCPACGSTVYWEPARKPELIAVAAGAFADPDLPAPDQSVWDDKRHAWVIFPAGLPTRSSR